MVRSLSFLALFCVPSICFADPTLLFEDVYIQEVFLTDQDVVIQISDTSSPIVPYTCAATLNAGALGDIGDDFSLFSTLAQQMNLKVDVYGDPDQCHSGDEYPHENSLTYPAAENSPGRGLTLTGLRIVSD